jgi:hypothetical protein
MELEPPQFTRKIVPHQPALCMKPSSKERSESCRESHPIALRRLKALVALEQSAGVRTRVLLTQVQIMMKSIELRGVVRTAVLVLLGIGLMLIWSLWTMHT